MRPGGNPPGRFAFYSGVGGGERQESRNIHRIPFPAAFESNIMTVQ
jgi:hypothetical protein